MSCVFEEINCNDVIWIVFIIILCSCIFSVSAFNIIYIAFNFHYLHPQDRWTTTVDHLTTIVEVDEPPTYQEAIRIQTLNGNVYV